MRSRRFSHFEIFKIVITIIYITSGILMFGTLITNASNHFGEMKSQEYQIEEISEIDCMNCDEID
jgi:hypothetical protein